MTDAEMLRIAKGLIKDPKNWCQGASRWRANTASDGWRRCSIGAIATMVSMVEKDPLKAMELQGRLNLFLGRVCHEEKPEDAWAYSIVIYNDEHTHEEVMALWDRAIAKAAAEEKNNSLPQPVNLTVEEEELVAV